MEFRHTRNQTAKGSRADAEDSAALYLFKKVSCMRLTYQIRLLAFLASESNRRLVLRVPAQCKIDAQLRAFCKDHAKTILIERV